VNPAEVIGADSQKAPFVVLFCNLEFLPSNDRRIAACMFVAA
jgi:hypothetical protein